MNTPLLIDKIKIGNIEFEAYIIKDENNLEAFAIYFQGEKEPLIMFQQVASNYKVELKINQDLVDKLQQFKSKDPQQRKEHFKIFQEFALNTEQKAKEIAFQDARLIYFSDIQLIKSIEQAFLVD
jgi:hypothetical protein